MVDEGDDSIKPIGELAEGNDDGMTVIPGSLCMACEGSGVTRMMMTKIPHFREVIVSSFECDDCGERNTEVQFGGEIQIRGCRYKVEIGSMEDLNRQVIKSDTARVRVPNLDLEIPAATQRGVISTVEGVLSRAAKELDVMQPLRRVQAPEQAQVIQTVVDSLEKMAKGEDFPFVLELDDPSGNSFVQDGNPAHYDRSQEDNIAIGLHADEAAPVNADDDAESTTTLSSKEKVAKAAAARSIEGLEKFEGDDVMAFPVNCPHCNAEGQERMCVAHIPHFKECVIMSFSCARCGFRNSEVKAGGAVPLKGIKVTVVCEDESDLARDMLKSDTASLSIPTLEIELSRGTLGSCYTTVEGMLEKIKKNLEAGNPFAKGDSAETETRKKFMEVIDSVDNLAKGLNFPFVLEINDPLANSFVGPRRSAIQVHDPLETFDPKEDAERTKDDRLTVEEYTRSWEEDEELGLHDIDTGDNNNLPVIDEEPEQHDPNMVDHPNPDFAKAVDDDTGERS